MNDTPTPETPAPETTKPEPDLPKTWRQKWAIEFVMCVVFGPLIIALFATGHPIWASVMWIFTMLLWGHILGRADRKAESGTK